MPGASSPASGAYRGGIARTHYDTLGVVRTASPEEIHAAYKRLARRAHPDAGGSERLMASVNEAHRVLSDPGRRAMYDVGLREPVPVPSWSVDRATSVDGEDDDDADVDFEPMAGWKHRLPAWSILLLGSLFAVFLVTAYAGSGRGTSTTTLPPADGLLAIGSCVVERSGGVVEEITCGGRRDGVVMALIQVGDRCPTGTDGLRRRDADGYACITRA